MIKAIEENLRRAMHLIQKAKQTKKRCDIDNLLERALRELNELAGFYKIN